MGVPLDTQNTTRQLDDDNEAGKQLGPGKTLANRYLVDQVIGSGGMGSVYRARDLHFPAIMKLVAIKEMLNQSRDDSVKTVLIQNFEREANIIATLSHPAIPRIYDFFIQGENAYLVLELIHGKDLEAMLRETPGFLTEEQVVRYAIELCDVLQYMHTHKPEPVIFRDMKPSNIMINQHDHVVVVDFGIAKNFRMGQRGTMMGTEGYSPPEQYRGEASPLVDIYAMGATLHHLLTKSDPQTEPPFTFAERPVRQYNPAVSPLMEQLINKAVEYKPENRFQNAEEMKQALINLQKKPAGVSPTVQFKADEPPINTDRCLWRFKCEDEIRGTPAYEAGTIFIGSLDNNLYALDSSTGEFVWKYPTRGAIVGRPTVREHFVYIGSEDAHLHVVATNGGRMIWTYFAGNFVRSSPRLTENYIFLGSDDGALHALNLNSGRRIWRFHIGGPVRSTACFENNLVYVGAETGDFYCLDLFGEPKWHFRAKRAITSSPTIMDEIVLFASMDGTLYAIDAKMGWEVWRYRMGKGAISSPVAENNMIFLGSIDGQIYAIDGDSGRDVWTYRTEHQVTGTPLVQNDRIYCGSVDGNLYCLEARTGRFLWKYATGGPITGAPIIVDETLYIGSTDHTVYAIAI